MNTINNVVRIDIEPQATPRPKVNKTGHVWYPAGYSDYKAAIAWAIKAKKVPKGNYIGLHAYFYFKYPSSKKTGRTEGAPHQVKPDVDNVAKGLLDAINDAGVLLDDCRISELLVSKMYTIEKKGYIEFCIF